MSIKRVLFIIAAISIAAVGLISCGGKAVSNQGYSGTTQSAPTTKAQASAATRGVKLEKEECEEKALEAGSPPREAGSGTADDEAFAVNIALLDARSKMAQQLEVLTFGAITNFFDKYKKGDSRSSYNHSEMRQAAYFERFLNNTRPICKNTYVKENGEYNVYVAIEIDDGIMSQIHNQISKDAEMDIDFKEHVFKEEMKDMRQKFLEGKR